MRPTYSDNAIGYVQLKREGTLCHVIARITPEHKIQKGAYKVHCEVDEGPKYATIKAAYCEDCAASQGKNNNLLIKNGGSNLITFQILEVM